MSFLTGLVPQKRMLVWFGLLLIIPIMLMSLRLVTQRDCALAAWDGRTTSECPDPSLCGNYIPAFVKIERMTIIYYFVIELTMMVSYCQYNIIWLLGGYYEKGWFEFVYQMIFVIPAWGIVMFVVHFQTWPFLHVVWPWLENNRLPLLPCMMFGNLFTVAYCFIRGKTEDQYRRAATVPVISACFLAVDMFMRSVFLPLFETLQEWMAAREFGVAVSFLGEYMLAAFYGTVFLPVTHKITMAVINFILQLSFGRVKGAEGLENKSDCKIEIDSHTNVSQSDFVPTDATPMATTYVGSDHQAIDADSDADSDVGADADHQDIDLDSDHSDHSDRPDESNVAIPMEEEGDLPVASQARKSENGDVLLIKRQDTVNLVPKSTRDMMEEKMITWMNILWDTWRFLLIRIVLLQTSFIYLFLFLAIKDFIHSIWHFGLRFSSFYITRLIHTNHPDRKQVVTWRMTLAIYFEWIFVKPFMIPRDMVQTVFRPELQISKGHRQSTLTARLSIASDGFAGALVRGLDGEQHLTRWQRIKHFLRRLGRDLVFNWKIAYRTLKNKFKSFLRNLVAKITFKKQNETNKPVSRDIRYAYANEVVIIKNVPSIENNGVHTYQNWLGAVIEELQNLIFNRTWPRLQLKMLSSLILLSAEMFVKYSIVGELPAYQEAGFSRTADGITRLALMVSFDILEVTTIWLTQRKSPYYKEILNNYEGYFNGACILLTCFNACAIACTSGLLRYLRKAPICGAFALYPIDKAPPILGQFLFSTT